MAGRHPHQVARLDLDRRLQRLAKLPVAVQARALASAMPLASREERQSLGAAFAQLCLPIRERENGQTPTSFWRRIAQACTWHVHDNSLDALRELALVWALLPEDVREVGCITGRGRWAALTPSLDPRDERALESLALCTAHTRNLDWMSFARRAACSENLSTRRTGERALLSLALWSAGEPFAPNGIEGIPPIASHEPGVCSSSQLLQVGIEVRAAWDALASYRPRGMVLAIIAACGPSLLRADVALAELFTAHDARAGVVLGALRSTPWDLARVRAWEWAAFAGSGTPARLAHACRARLSNAATSEEHASVLMRVHMGLVPQRATVARGVIVRGARRLWRGASSASVPARSALPEPSATKQLPTQARRELARWTHLIRADVPTKVAACEPLLTDPEPSVRLSLARWGPGPLLADVSHDSHPSVAVAAHARLIDEAAERGAHVAVDRGSACSLIAHRTMMRHARSPHAVIRALAGGVPAESDALRSGVHGRQRLWTWLRDDRAGLLDYLRAACASSRDDDAIAALLTARRMGLAGELADAALDILRPSKLGEPATSRRVATVASFLGACPRPDVRTELIRLTHDADPRVQANAIDALLSHARIQPLSVDVLELATTLEPHIVHDEPHHRVRGSAVRAMLLQGKSGESDAGADALTQMLLDARPPHRLAGVWVLGRVRSWMAHGESDWLGVRAGCAARMRWWPQWRACVQEMSTRETDPHLSRRVAACATLLEIESGPSGLGAHDEVAS